jgi:hypothetical protein
MIRKPWTPSQDGLLRELYPENSAAECGAVLGRGVKAIYWRAAALGLKKPRDWIANRARMRSARPDHGGIACRFQPGQAPWNKGKPHPGSWRAIDTQFKPGQKPHTWQPIGHERISADGYPQIKMSDTGVTRRDYINISHLVWFYAGRGDIPPGHALIFKDGNKQNATLDNLELVTRAELMQRNTLHRYGKEIARVAQLRGAINRQINRRTRPEAA